MRNLVAVLVVVMGASAGMLANPVDVKAGNLKQLALAIQNYEPAQPPGWMPVDRFAGSSDTNRPDPDMVEWMYLEGLLEFEELLFYYDFLIED